MRRVLRPGGTIIIIETLGTGETEPHPMADWFAEYFDFLENDLGFQSTWIRTDFKFDSLDQAAATISFFFGDEWDEKVRRQQLDHSAGMHGHLVESQSNVESIGATIESSANLCANQRVI